MNTLKKLGLLFIIGVVILSGCCRFVGSVTPGSPAFGTEEKIILGKRGDIVKIIK